MSRLLSCEITGLAGRPDTAHFDLRPDVNIFFGLNGTGKTTLLKILASAIRNDISLLRRAPFFAASVSFQIDGQKEPVLTTISQSQVVALPQQQQQLVTVGQQQFVMPIGPQPGWTLPSGAPSPPHICSYLSTFRMLGDQQPGFFYGGDAQPYSEARIDQLFASHVLQRWQNFSNTLLSQIRQKQESGLASILESLFKEQRHKPSARPIDVDTAYEGVRHFLNRQSLPVTVSKKDFVGRYEADDRLKAVVDDIDAVEQEIATLEQPRRQLEELVEEFVSTNKKIKFSESAIEVEVNNGQNIGIDLLSSGEKQLLRILVEVLGNSDNPILIDEPELSMHIDWQRQVVRALRTVNPAAQVILATHSPEIMADLPDEEIMRL